MIPKTIVEHDESGLIMVLNAMELLKEERFIEGIRYKLRTPFEIQQMADTVLWYQHRVNIESNALSHFSEEWLSHWATKNNHCFGDAEPLFRRLQSTMKGLSEVFYKLTPSDSRPLYEGMEAPSVYEKSALTSGSTQLELFPLKDFPEEVQKLYHAIETLFSSASSSLALCHRMIEDERAIRGDRVLLRQIFDQTCKDALCAVRSVADINFSIEELDKNEIEQRRRQAKSQDDFIRDGYHNFDDKTANHYFRLKEAENAYNQGLTPTEKFFFKDDVEKALRVRKVIQNFHLVRDVKGQRGKLSSKVIVDFLKWCGVLQSQEKQLYERYFIPTYLASHPLGELKPIGWSTIDGERKKEGLANSNEKRIARFESRLSAIFSGVQEMPQNTQEYAQPA